MEVKKYYEDYHNFRVNTCPHRSYFIPYSDQKTALDGNRNQSKRLTLLNGNWGFAYYTNIHRVPSAALSPAAKLSSFETIKVPSNWQLEGYDQSEFLTDGLPFPINPPFVPTDTPVGVYVKDITIHNINDGQHRFLVLEGVDHAFYLYINGTPVGYSSNSHSMSEFDCTAYLKNGVNRIAIVVMKWSVASYLAYREAFQHAGISISGIFRDVYLLTRPMGGVQDITIQQTISPDYKTAVLSVTVHALCPQQIDLTLFDPSGETIGQAILDQNGKCHFEIQAPSLWNGESPKLYTLLTHYKGEYTPHKIGLRQIDIEKGMFRLNGRRVTLKGVNYEEFTQESGTAVSYQQLKQDLLCMKAHHINAVRTANGPTDPRFLELCDAYGLYVLAQADLNTDGFLHTKQNPLSDCSEFSDMIFDRINAMVFSAKNHASVIMWSVGASSQGGSNLPFALQKIRELDSSRPIYCEGFEADMQETTYPADADIIGFHSPTLSFCKEFITKNSQDIRPILLGSYADITEKAKGTLPEYQALFQKDARFMGGFLPRWCDLNLHTNCTDIHSHYGMDGLVNGNGQPYSTLYEVSAVFAPFKVNPKDIEKGEFYITNLLDFTYLSRFECCYEVTRYGKIVSSGSMGILPISPGQCESITIPYQLPPNGICHVRIFFRLFGDTPYAKSGTEMGFFQFLLPVSTEDAKENISFPSPTWKENENEYILSAKGCRYVFSRLYGTLTEISLNNKNLLATPWKLQCFKAPTVSDKQVLQEWYEAGYHQLQSRCESTQLVCEGNTVKITAHLILGSKGKEPIFTVQTTYVFYGDGTLTFACQLDSKEALPPLPRLGVAFELPEQYNQFRYLGFGPHENDRYQNHSAYLGDFSYKIKPFSHSRLNENRQGYLCQLTNNKEVGLAVWQADEMGFSTLPSSCGNHHTILHLDAFASFYGSQEKTAIHHTFGFSLKPVTKEDNVLSDLLK